ncbi:ribonuclease HII [Candidatus Saccharibacteria bacterium]|nr:ribonuclease HII [Candidatus Saccharibacteria bacterium]
MAILGIDEVGRGPLAGPLVVGAVILPDEKPEWVYELRDSKKLSAKKREKLSEIILEEAPAFGLGFVSPYEIDERGISEALRLATRRAVEEVQRRGVAFSQIVIDGKVNFLAKTKLENYVSVKIKADNLIKEVSAASIIAKVARDRYMIEIAERFPGYGFEKHVGYGTAAHIKAINELGICEEHRKSFEPIRSMVGFERATNQTVVKNTTMIGAGGEELVCEYLMSQGHEIILRNFKTCFYEIDIISVCGENIYFTEVKTRKNDSYGGGLAAIDRKKLEQMKFAAECFMKYKRIYNIYNPKLAVASVDGAKKEVLDWFALV